MARLLAALTQVLASAQMLSPPEMTTLDLLAQAVAEARMIEEEQEDLLQDVEVCEDCCCGHCEGYLSILLRDFFSIKAGCARKN